MTLRVACNKLLETYDDHISGEVCFHAGAMRVSTDPAKSNPSLNVDMEHILHNLSITVVHIQQRHWHLFA